MTDAKRVLVVDDSQLMLDSTQAALMAAGYEVVVAQDLAALDRAQQTGTFDLILMDVQMPELFGDDVAMALRDIRGVAAPIYLFSSLDDQELESRAQDAEISGYISKRNGLEALIERVHAILGSSGA